MGSPTFGGRQWDDVKCFRCGRRRSRELVGQEKQVDLPAGRLTVLICSDRAECDAYVENRGVAT